MLLILKPHGNALIATYLESFIYQKGQGMYKLNTIADH